MGRFGEVDSNAEYALKNNLSAIIAPTVNDDSSNGYEPGSVWIDNTGKAAYQCVDASVGAAIWTTLSIPISNAFGLFTQTSDSAVVEDTTTETTIIGSGVGSLSVPANQFIVGDTYKGIIAGKKSNVNNHTIQFDIKVDGDIILSSGPITLGGSTNTNWELIVDFTIRQIGGAGVASIHVNGRFLTQTDGGQEFEGTIFDTTNNTTFDTTKLNTLDILVTWGTEDPGDSIYSDQFVLTKVY